MDLGFAGKRILIAGAGVRPPRPGFGRVAALKLAAEGARTDAPGRIADGLERRTWRQLDLFVRLLEPLMLLLLALVVLLCRPWAGGGNWPWMVAPMGASAVLVFAVPESPFDHTVRRRASSRVSS